MYVGGGDTVAPGQFLMTKDGILKGQSIQYEHMVSTLSFNLYSSIILANLTSHNFVILF